MGKYINAYESSRTTHLIVEQEDMDTLKEKDGRKKKSQWFLYSTAIVVNLFTLNVTSGFSWTSSATQMLKSNDTTVNPLGVPITAVEESWIGSLLPLGAAIGPIFAGKLSNVLGHKKALLVIAIPQAICYIVLYFATNINIFYVCRLVMGMVTGTVFAIAPSYLSEISEVHNRGIISTIFGIFMNLGILFCYLVGPLCSFKSLTIIWALPLLLFLIFSVMFVPESPIYLISTNRKWEAEKALEKLRGSTDVQGELQEMIKTCKVSESNEKGIIDLFKEKGLRKACVISIGLMIILQSSGITPIISYLETIFKMFGSNMSLYISTNLVGGIQVVWTILSAIMVDKIGRKLLLLTSVVGLVISHVALVIYFYFRDIKRYDVTHLSYLPITLTFVFISAYGIGLSALPFTITSEIFPHSTKVIGTSLGSSTNFFCCFMMTFGFRILLEVYGMVVFYFILSIFMFFAILFIYFVVPETKGKTEEQIRDILNE